MAMHLDLVLPLPVQPRGLLVEPVVVQHVLPVHVERALHFRFQPPLAHNI
jgi:hypothetical protein